MKKYFGKRLCSKLKKFLFKKVKNTVPSTNFITDLNGEEIVGMF